MDCGIVYSENSADSSIVLKKKMADKTDNEASEVPLAAKSTPKDALVMAAILKEMGISEYDPRVINQMLEYTYREF